MLNNDYFLISRFVLISMFLVVGFGFFYWNYCYFRNTYKMMEDINKINEEIKKIKSDIEFIEMGLKYNSKQISLIDDNCFDVLRRLDNIESIIYTIDDFLKSKGIHVEDNVVATSYCNDGITASGKKTNTFHISVSRDLFEKWGKKYGKKIILFEKKNDKVYYIGTFLIQDLMAKHIKKTVDVFKDSCKESLEFGVKKNCFAIVY